jgi:rubrerythrin
MDLYVLGLAIIIPLAWSVIFYPVLRKSKKSWHNLVIVASVLSFLTLILKEMMAKVNPVLAEMLIYASGIVFGVAALYFIFKSKSKWLEAMPKENVSFRNQEIETKVPLRYMFQVAVLVEQQGKEFYEKLAEKASDVKARELWQGLAYDETAHKRLFENILSRWLPRPADKESLDSLTQALRGRGLFSNPPLPDATEEDVIKYAIQQEEMTADFYLSFESAFPDAWKRIHIRSLVTTERQHAERLRTFLPAS